MDIRQIPAIGGRGVIGTGRVDADQIGQRPHQHIVARARPRFIRNQHAMGVDVGVEKEVHGHPAGAAIDPMLCQGAVEVVRAVGVAGIADVVIVFRRAGHGEGIVAADGVLHHLDQGDPLLIVVFRVQAGHGIGMAHQRARGGDVERVLDAAVEFAGVKALEIGALAAFDVDDLDVVACFDEIAFRRGGFYPQIKDRIGKRIGQVELADLAKFGALQVQRERCGGVLCVRHHRQAGGGKNEPAIIERGKFGPCAGVRVGREKAQGTGAGQINAFGRDGTAQGCQTFARRIAQGEHRLQPLSPRV